MLQLRMLKNITGLSWSAVCKDCSFYRTNVTWSPEPPFEKTYLCLRIHIVVNEFSQGAQRLNKTYFHYRCKSNAEYDRDPDFHCKSSSEQSYYRQVYTTNLCWPTLLIAITCISVVAVLTALLNLVVFVTILSSRALRKNVSMLFVCNLAVSDFLIDVYIVCIGIYWNSAPFSYLHDNSERNCLKIGFLWMLGQSSAVSTSLLLTVERYLVIVYTMNPDLRISRRMAVILLVMVWLVAFFFTGFALYYNLYSQSFLCVPIAIALIRTNPVFVFTVVVASLTILSYLIIFILYFHIYINAKRTAQTAGFKRESKLAKRVALIVFTNVFLFVLPLVLSSVAAAMGSHVLSNAARGQLTHTMPGLSVCLNSLLNPLLYAYRTELFMEVLKKKVSRLRQQLGG